ncbi:MFS transporter [Sporosarcina sp. BI001-red]|uniref:CynX/NimT family MFS transporter n=1 Tax=Sporosarcina sp. BI001-red TaxID=2282866 RepID=UPI000E2418D8|nr:MFS transporter [Sporosarcina sp. BI001-red]REB11651.1 MFS transporter [Sporosarcina sp. BI001-red]
MIGVILIAANLRAPLTSIGSLITSIRTDLGISHALAGTITTLPLLAFAILSPFAPKIAHKITMEKTIFLSLVVLAIGIVIRSLFGTGALFTGTILIGIAIAFGNVLLPGFIKMNFPLKVGIMTGMYGVFMNVFAALGSGLSVPLTTVGAIGWKGSLAFWAIPVIIAIAVWAPQMKKGKDPTDYSKATPKEKLSLARSPLAWSITIFMGLQSLIFYTLVTWLPEILQGIGYSMSAAGWMLFLMQFAIIPFTFIIPLLAERLKNQILLGGATAVLFILGITGVLIGNHSLMPLSVIMIGMGAGSAFSLSMMFFSMRTSNAVEASDMSGMAQSFGYLLAATGPMVFGALHDRTDSWTMPLIMLIALAVVILIVGIVAGRDRVIGNTISKESQI